MSTHAVPLGFVDRVGGAEARDAGRVHQDVDRTEVRDDALDAGVHHVGVAHVGTSNASHGCDVGHGHVDSRDPRAFVGEPLRARGADPRAGAGDERDLALEPSGHVPVPFAAAM